MATPVILKTPKRRWRFLDELIRGWGQPDWDRTPFVETDRPRAAQGWFSFTGAAQRFNDPEVVCLRDGPPVWKPVPGHPAWSLNELAEGDVHSGVLAKHLRLVDPPVWNYCLDYNAKVKKGDPLPFAAGVEAAPHVSAFALDWTLSYLYPDGGMFHTQVAEGAYSVGGSIDRVVRPPTRVGHLFIHGQNDVLVSHLADGAYERSLQRRTVSVFFRTKAAARNRHRVLDELLSAAMVIGGSLAKETETDEIEPKGG